MATNIVDRTNVTTYDLETARKFLSHADPVLRTIIAKNPDLNPREWMRDLPKLDTFGVLIFQVIGQQLSVDSTRAILNRLLALFGGVMPTPDQFLALPSAKIHSAGLSGRKVETIREVAKRFSDGTLSQKEFDRLSDEQIIEKLTSIKGIGPWTAHGFLLIALDRPDVITTGDLALRKIVKKLYRLQTLPTQEKVLAIAEKWRPYRTLATSYLFTAAYGGKED